jgi:hypothetical protein
MRSRIAGGCDFAHDPGLTANDGAVFWAPRLYPNAIALKPVTEPEGPFSMLFDLGGVSGLVFRAAEDGWHAVWTDAGIAHQIWLRDAPPSETALYEAAVLYDACMELRAHAARRFWRALVDRPPGRDFRVMPIQLRRSHVLALRVVDARNDGASYRTIAEVLFGFIGSKMDWENDWRKNKVRRALALGRSMVQGGYRSLLYYPLKIGRK